MFVGFTYPPALSVPLHHLDAERKYKENFSLHGSQKEVDKTLADDCCKTKRCLEVGKYASAR